MDKVARGRHRASSATTDKAVPPATGRSSAKRRNGRITHRRNYRHGSLLRDGRVLPHLFSSSRVTAAGSGAIVGRCFARVNAFQAAISWTDRRHLQAGWDDLHRWVDNPAQSDHCNSAGNRIAAGGNHAFDAEAEGGVMDIKSADDVGFVGDAGRGDIKVVNGGR